MGNSVRTEATKPRYLPLILPSQSLKEPRRGVDGARPRSDSLTLSPRAAPANSDASADPILQTALVTAACRQGLEDAGVVLIDLASGKTASLNGRRTFSPASVIKVAVLAEVFHQAQLGKIRLDQPVTVRPENMTDTWLPRADRRPALRPGRRATVRELVELMITRSDNVATNTLVDVVGRQNLNAFLRILGLGTTQFHHKLSGGAVPVRDSGYDGGRNQTTAGDMARLLALIARGQLVSPAASQEMLAILGEQMDNDKIPARLPRGTRVYHKTGETSRVTHDVAVIESGGRRYVLAVLTNRAPGPDTYRRIAALAAEMHGRSP